MLIKTITGVLLAGYWLIAPQLALANPDPCAAEAIANAGAFAAFNSEQCEAFNAPLRTEKPQLGNTCVCESLLNAAFDLGIHGDMNDLKEFDCEGAIFGDIFARFADGTDMKGRVFGGASGLLRTFRLTTADAALDTVIRAVAAGKVVAISLDAKPIYDEIAAITGIPYTWSTTTNAHALVIRAILKDELGRVVAAGVIDSSGPGRRYWVSMIAIRNAYTSLRSIAARGVYVSDARRKRTEVLPGKI